MNFGVEIALFLAGVMAMCTAETMSKRSVLLEPASWMSHHQEHPHRAARAALTKEGSEDGALACFFKCSPTSLSTRHKRDTAIEAVSNHITKSWKGLLLGQFVYMENFCSMEKHQREQLDCLKNQCLPKHSDNALLNKIVESMGDVVNMQHQICENNKTEEIECLSQSSMVYLQAFIGLTCTNASEDFQQNAVVKTGNHMVISGEKLCGLFSCPAEVSQSMVDEECKKIDREVLTKMSELQFYSFSFGFEEGKKILGPLVGQHDLVKETGDKCADLVY